MSLSIVAVVGIGGWLGAGPVQAAYGDVTTFLGKVYDGDGGSARAAWLDFPEDLEFDSAGNLYVADTFNNVIRKIDTNGNISTYAGSGHWGFYNAAGTDAELAGPRGLAIDASGNLYVADTDNDTIRKIDIYRSVSTVVSGTVEAPEGLIVYGSTLYIADTGNNAVKKLNLTTGQIDILTSDVSGPKKLALNDAGTILYVADSGNHRVVSVNTSTSATNLVAGGSEGYAEGTGSAAKFENLWGVDYDGGILYVTDGDGLDDRIRKIDLLTNATSLLVRDLRMQVVNYPHGIRVRGSKLFIASTGIGVIQAFDKTTGADTEADFMAGVERFGYRNGSLSQALFGRPASVVMSPNRRYLYIADNNKIRQVDLETDTISLVIGNSIDDYIGESYIGADARFSNITSMAISPDGSILYVIDRWSNRIRGVNIANQSSFLIAGGGNFNTRGPGNGYTEAAGTSARFDNPFGLTISPDGSTLYVTDTANRRIRKIDITSGQTSLIAGSGSEGSTDGVGAAASFKYPAGITIDTSGQNLYVADRDGHTIRKIRLSDNTVTTLVGSGSAGYRDAIGIQAALSLPLYVQWGADEKLYFTEAGSHRIRLVEPSTNLTKLIAGSGHRGYNDSSRTDAKFNTLGGLALDWPGRTLFVADSQNDLIRRVNVTGQTPYTEPAPVVQGVSPSQIKADSNPVGTAYLDVLGAYFVHGIQTQFGDHRTTAYVKTSTSLTVVIPLGQMATGWYDVQVTNLDGQSDVLQNAFAVSDSAGNVPDRYHQIAETDGFLAYSALFTGGVNVAAGDVDADGKAEIITAPSTLGGPHIRVFSEDGTLESQFFAYATSYRGGVTVASCDINSDGRDEIIVGTGAGKAPHVRVFSATGQVVSQFFAYPESFRIGVSVACGNVAGDSAPEIVVSPLVRGGPHIRVFSSAGQLVSQFFAYPESFRLGLDVAVADLDGSGLGKIIVAPVTNGGPHVRVFSATGQLQSQFFAYDQQLRTGINVSAGDTDGDGTDEIITGPENGGAPHIRVFKGNGQPVVSFFGFESRLRTGVHTAVGDTDGDSVGEVIAAPAAGRPSIKTYSTSDYL